MEEVSIGQSVGVELVLRIHCGAWREGPAGKTYRHVKRSRAGKGERSVDKPERMSVGHIPCEFDASLRIGAVSLDIGQRKARSCAAVRNMDLIS